MLSKNAIELLTKRYCRNESPEQVYERTAKYISDGDEDLFERLYNLMIKSYFLPNSPALFNAGYRNMLHACCVLDIEDNMESIAEFEYRMTMMFKYGAGVGTNYSKLREKSAKLSSGGTSSGVMSLIEVQDKKIDYVKQGGFRRGAGMGILWYWHPEILDFVQRKIKGGITNLNLSVMVDSNFFENLDSDLYLISPSTKESTYSGMKNKDLFDIISFCAWSCGCPGMLFFDRINQDNPLYPNVIIDKTNPCSESPLLDNTLCCLGSINLSKFVRNGEFNFDKFLYVIQIATKALLNMNRLGWYPFDFMKKAMDKYNPIGLGVMGFADCLIKLGINYDSEECLKFIDTIGEILDKETKEIAGESFYRTIIAPTGSLSILADCSSGIEPVFADVFERNLTVGKIEETRDIYKSEYCKTAFEITPEWHLKVLAQWQKWTTGGVSKTINMPNHSSIEDVKNIYYNAWKSGCKGITIYRDMSKDSQVLYRKPSCEGETCSL